MTLKESKYGYAVARTRALENSLLDKNKLERLVAADSLADALAQLADTVYAEAVAELSEEGDWEQALAAHLRREYDFIAEMGHGQELLTLRWRYDFVNLKLLLKAKKLGGEPQQLSALGSVPPEQLVDRAALPASWQEAILAAEQTEDPQKMDLILDRAFFQAALGASQHPYLRDLWRLQIDLANITTFLRLSALKVEGRTLWEEAFIPGGQLESLAQLTPPDLEALQSQLAWTKYGESLRQGLLHFQQTGSWGLWEKLADNLYVEYLNAAKYIPFGPEPLLAYVLGREHEVKQLRIILAGKANQLSSEEIEERLREVYG